MPAALPPHLSSLLVFLLFLLTPTLSLPCPCGYTLPSAPSVHFTSLLETDFLHLRSFSSPDTGWLPQAYSMTAAQSHGPYGMLKERQNLLPNYIEDETTWEGMGMGGGGPGLELWVRAGTLGMGEGDRTERFVSTSEIVSARNDILYGSFRIAMRTTDVPGTCAAFFFYRNDTEEIDVEILSSEQPPSYPLGSGGGNASFPIHILSRSTSPSTSSPLVSHHIYNTTTPSADPTENYNEYRLDWLPTSLSFYLNGALIWKTEDNIPSTPGRLHISHWSNGDPLWSGGPPEEDAVVRVGYVKGYFNVSGSSGGGAECGGAGWRGRVCEVPDQKGSLFGGGEEGNGTGRTVFLGQRGDEGGEGRNGDGVKKGLASRRRPSCRWIALITLVCVVVGLGV